MQIAKTIGSGQPGGKVGLLAMFQNLGPLEAKHRPHRGGSPTVGIGVPTWALSAAKAGDKIAARLSSAPAMSSDLGLVAGTLQNPGPGKGLDPSHVEVSSPGAWPLAGHNGGAEEMSARRVRHRTQYDFRLQIHKQGDEMKLSSLAASKPTGGMCSLTWWPPSKQA